MTFKALSHDITMGGTMNRILEAVVVTLFYPPLLIVANLSLFIIVLFSNLKYLLIFYGIWWYISRNYDSQGGRQIKCLKHLRLWKYYAQYFPINLIKTEELDPNKNYLCGFHPHGYFAGLTINFLTEATEFSVKFPNLRSWVVALKHGFTLPFYRDLALAFGIRSCSRESIKWLLTKEDVGNMVVLVPGGIREMRYTEQNKFIIKLESRKGFIRIAIETGSSLVPILSFGENDIYHIPEAHTWLGCKLNKYKSRANTNTPIHYGPIKFIPTLPFRVPLYTIVGKPIDVTQNNKPTDDEICSLHSVYVEKLRQLYNEYKDQFGYTNVPLEII